MVVFLRGREISGQITSIVDEVGGKTVTVDQDTGGEIDVFVFKNYLQKIEGFETNVKKGVTISGRFTVSKFKEKIQLKLSSHKEFKVE